MSFGEYKPFECGGEGCSRIIPESNNWAGYEVVCSVCGHDNGALELRAGADIVPSDTAEKKSQPIRRET